MNFIRIAYLDASALVALFVEEPFTARLRSGLASTDQRRTNMYCIVEALGVLKRKRNDDLLSVQQYADITYEMLAYVRGPTIDIERVSLTELDVFAQAEQYVTRHGLDFIDALQLFILLFGSGECFRGSRSEAFLVTLDKGLADAVRKEGGIAWFVRKEELPPAQVTRVLGADGQVRGRGIEQADA